MKPQETVKLALNEQYSIQKAGRMENIMPIKLDPEGKVMKTLSKPTEKSDNELIAEFMGWTRLKTIAGESSFSETIWYDENSRPIESIHFFESFWDWIMPVVEKINTTRGFRHEEVAPRRMFGLSIFTPLPELHRHVVDYIKWYNLNQITPKP